MKAIHKVDQITYGMLLAGALNSAVTGLTRFSAIQKISGKKATGIRVYYGILGAVTAYKLLRVFGPKTKEEKRIIKLSEMFDRADDYKHKAEKYGHTANKTFNQSVKQLDKYLIMAKQKAKK